MLQSYVSTMSDPSLLRRTAAVVRNRRDILDIANFNAGCSQRTDRRFASGTWAADSHFHAAHAMIASHISGVRGSLLRGEGRTLTRSAKTERTRTLPGEDISRLVRDSHNRVVEGRLNVHHAKRDVLALLLLEGFLLALLLRRRGAARCWFCHKSVSSD